MCSLYFLNTKAIAFLSVFFVLTLVLKKIQIANKSILQSRNIHSRLLITLYISFFGLGYINAFLFKADIQHKHFSQLEKEHNLKFIKIRLKEYTIEKENSYKALATVISVKIDSEVIETKGDIICYFSKDSISKNLSNGDILQISNKVQKIAAPKNPYEFDYQNYLRQKNISHQVYLKQENYILIQQGQSFFSKTLHQTRNKLQRIINENINGANERAVASALLLGNRNFLTDDILQSFSSTGATHVLAVSGLHVGIFYFIVSLSFAWLKRFKKLKILHPIIIILFIWLYVVLTGGSPSVIRAATMFSLIAIGRSFERHISIYNIIAFSAFIITLVNPFIITDVGFQLSYLAVIGIIYLQAKIYKWLYIENWLGDKIWAITSVSIAANISTFPIILYYFHQFPNYFLLSNLIVIPAASLILYGGVFLFVFSASTLITKIIGKIVSCIIFGLNKSLSILENIPYAVTTKISINILQALTLYLLVIFFIFAIENRNKLLLRYFLWLMLIASISFSFSYYTTQTQKSFIVYHIPKHSALEITHSTHNYSAFDSTLWSNNNLISFRIEQNWLKKQIKSQHLGFENISSSYIGKNKILSVSNKRILLIDKEYSIPELEVNVDFVIVSHNPKLYLKAFTPKIKASTYIFDTSNDKIKEKYWKQDCDSLGINCYFVSQNNAYQITL